MATTPDPRPRIHRRWVLMCVFGSVAFALLAAGVAWSDRVVHLDESLDAALNEHARQSPATVRLMLAVAKLGTLPAFVVLSVLVAGGYCAAGRPRLAAAWLLVVIGGGLWIEALKHTFDRPRPPYNRMFTTEESYSFPSGHAASSAVAYGMLAYCLALRWRTRRQRVALVAGFGAFVLFIGFTRLYLGVHYLSDVLAGYALALAWVGLSVYLIEWASAWRTTRAAGASRPR